MFTSENIHQVEFKSPTCFPTYKELLSNAEFTIVNLKTGEQLKLDEGSPTCFLLLGRKRRMNNFNIFLESNDKASMLKFNSNYIMEFTIALPERFRFGDWEVRLKWLILPSKVWNVYYETMPKWSFRTNLNVLEEAQGFDFEIGQDSYEIVDIILTIQQILDKYDVPIEITFNSERKRVIFKLKKKKFLRRRIIVHYFSMVI